MHWTRGLLLGLFERLLSAKRSGSRRRDLSWYCG
jgi:hypothetical protein